MIKIIRVMTLAGLITAAACQANSPNSSQAYELPACAQPQPVPQRSYIVFFDQHSAVVTSRGTKMIQQFDTEFSIFSNLDVFIVAGMDTSETSARDRGLDTRRGEAVARLMRQFGISSDSRFHIVAAGTKSPLVQTPPLTPEPLNRSAILFTRGGRQIRPDTLQSECLSWLREHQCGPQVSAAQQSVCVKVRGVAGAFSP